MKKSTYAMIGVVILLVALLALYSPTVTGLSVFTMSPEVYCASSGWTLKNWHCSGTTMYVTCVDSGGSSHYATLNYHQMCGATACGDGTCGVGEDYINCPADCPPPASVPYCSTVNCDDGDPCTVDSCNEQLRRCFNSYVYSGEASYDDNNRCTNDYCLNKQIRHDPITCDDGNRCTTDSCSPSIGCVYTEIVCQSGYECDASTGLCKYIDPCEGIVCQAYCTGYTLSHSGVCVSGECVYDTEPNSETCGYDLCLGVSVEDYNDCTYDYCVSGEVFNEPVICPPNTNCNPATGLCEGVGFEPSEPQTPIIPILFPLGIVLPISILIVVVSILVIGRRQDRW